MALNHSSLSLSTDGCFDLPTHWPMLLKSSPVLHAHIRVVGSGRHVLLWSHGLPAQSSTTKSKHV